jgi:HAD superfamily hydrolase (TIGR01509 family)
LFDMDGTLCDTEPSWMAAEYAMAERYGATWTVEDGLALIGNDLQVSGEYIKQVMGLSLRWDEIIDELLDGVIGAIRANGVTWQPGAVELLAALNGAGVPTALVTMSYASFAETVVAQLPHGRFDALVTGDRVARGKPAPDPYLLAAAMLGVDARNCVAIEDSGTGAASAEAAGCLVVVVPNQVDVPNSPQRRHFSSLEGVKPDDLAELLSQR